MGSERLLGRTSQHSTPLFSGWKARALGASSVGVLALNTETVIEEAIARTLNARQDRMLVLSNHLHKTLREALREMVHGDEQYDELFDEFEYFLRLAFCAADPAKEWLPIGRYFQELSFGGQTIWERMGAGVRS